MFDTLTPQQKQLLKFGAPLVAAVAVGAKIAGSRKAAEADPAAAPATGTIGAVMPSTDAIGVGQLAEFEGSLSTALAGVQQALESLVASPNPVTPTPVPPAGATPAPTPAPTATPVQPSDTRYLGAPTPAGSLPPAPTYALTPYNAPPNPVHPSVVDTTPRPATTPAPPPSGRTHVVKAGETLSVIGRYYGIPWQLIAQANRLGGGTSLTLHAGQVLILPRYP